MSTYKKFLETKTQYSGNSGFDPLWVPEFLFDFQRALVEWALRKGRAAIFADCGLGKTAMQLVWAENVARKTGKPVLILTPLAVGAQTIDEGKKFGIEAVRSSDGKHSAKIVVTNYQRLHYFDPSEFAGAVCDESSCLKDETGKTKAAVTEFMRMLPYRLLCTATAAPNDYVELGTSSEVLGELGFQDMVTKFFKKENQKDHLGWGRVNYRLRGHAERDFWRWVCSWARAVRKPSDLGFDDAKFILPELITREHEVSARTPAKGRLFDTYAETLQEQREERRRTLPERCEKAAELVSHKEPAIAWCDLNDEGNMLTKLIKGAEQVSGSDSDERKEEILSAFARGEINKLVSKPVIAGYGLNFQHCAHQTFFPSHSYEQYFQAVRRSWRFGQKRPVTIDVVSTEGSGKVLANLQRKSDQADAMFSKLVELMNDSLRVNRSVYGSTKMEAPEWLSSTKC